MIKWEFEALVLDHVYAYILSNKERGTGITESKFCIDCIFVSEK